MHYSKGRRSYFRAWPQLSLILVLAFVLVFALIIQQEVQAAATITVDGTTDNVTVAALAGNGTCDLREAVEAAVTNATVGECVYSGSDPDLIQINVAAINLAGTLDLTSDMTLNGPYMGWAVLDGGSAFQVLHVNSGVTVTLQGINITQGSAAQGAGLYNDGGIVNLDNSIFSDNVATSAGGGFYNAGGTVDLVSTVFTANIAQDIVLPDGYGAGFYSNGGTVTAWNSTFSGNDAYLSGGGFYNSGGSLTIDSSEFLDNSANLSGGGLANLGPLTLGRSTFSGNVAGDSGGGIYSSATANISSSTLTGNQGINLGGGLYNDAATANISNITIADNYSGSGGGFYNNLGAVNVKNSLIVAQSGGGNCGGSAPSVEGINYADDATCSGFTQDAAAGSLLDALADNGGLTQTRALLVGNPAIDAASDCTYVSTDTVNSGSVLTDQRGGPRPADGDDDDTAVCDAGAFERYAPAIHLNEMDTGALDSIELYNGESSAISLDGWHFLGYNMAGVLDVNYIIPTGFTLAAGDYVMLWEGSGVDDANNLYMNDDLRWNLQGGSAILTESHSIGIDFVRYGSASLAAPYGLTWTGSNPAVPASYNDLGRSASSVDTDDGSDWCEQMPTLGSQNFGCGPETMPSVVFNELDAGIVDSIEIYNATGASVDLTGWHFQGYAANGVQDVNYSFPSFTLAADAYVSLWEGSGIDDASNLYMNDDVRWALQGGAAALLDDRFNGVDFMQYGSAAVTPPTGTSWTGPNPAVPASSQNLGRDEISTDSDAGSDWCSQPATFGSVNVGCNPTTASIVISELDNGAVDGIEIYNTGGSAVNMTGWKFKGYAANGVLDVNYTFPSFTLQPDSYVVLHEGSGTDTDTDLYINDDVRWGLAGGAAALLNASNVGVDFLCFGSNGTTPPTGTTWVGEGAASPPAGSTETLGRDGAGTDTDSASDWCVGATTFGLENGSCGLGSPSFFFAPTGSDPDNQQQYFMPSVEAPEVCVPFDWRANLSAWPQPHDPTDLVRAVFPMPQEGIVDLNGNGFDDTLLDALNYASGDATRDLLREATTGLLNAAAPNVTYPIAEWQVVVDTGNALLAGGQAISDQAVIFAGYNAQACAQ